MKEYLDDPTHYFLNYGIKRGVFYPKFGYEKQT